MIFAWFRHQDASTTRTEAAVPEARCCFCQKGQHKAANLIAGPENLRICDECVALMCDIIAEQNDRCAQTSDKAPYEARFFVQI